MSSVLCGWGLAHSLSLSSWKPARGGPTKPGNLIFLWREDLGGGQGGQEASLSLSALAYLLHYGSGAMLHVQKEIKLKFRNSKVFRSFSNTKCAVKPCKTNKLSLTPCYVERMALMEEERNLRHGVGGGGWMGSTHLILRKMLSKSRFISTRVLVWCRKRSFICCRRALDRLLKLSSISLVFSKRSSLAAEKGHRLLCSASRALPTDPARPFPAP